MKLTDYKHVIWDFNGTLLNDSWLCAEVVDEMLLGRAKQPLGLEQYRRLYDLPLEDFYQRIGFDLRTESFEDIAAEFIFSYDSRRSECRLQDGAQRVLAHLQASRTGQSVLSAYELCRLRDALDDLRIRPFFDSVFGMDHHKGGDKAHLGIELRKTLGLDSDRILLVGDTVHDHEVAMEMGVDCLLIAAGHHSFEKLSNRGAKVAFSLAELL